MQFAQLLIVVFGFFVAASAAPQFLVSHSSASLQEGGNHVEGSPSSSSVVNPAKTGQKPTLQDTQKLQSTHETKESEFLKVVDAIMKAMKLHANGNNQQSSNSQGPDVIEISTKVSNDDTNIAKEHATNHDVNVAFSKKLHSKDSKVEETPRKTPLESDFDQIIEDKNPLQTQNEKVTEVSENKPEQKEVKNDIKEVIFNPSQEVKKIEILPTEGGDVQIVTKIIPLDQDSQVNLKTQKIIGQENPMEVQHSELAVEKTATEISLVEDGLMVAPASGDQSVSIVQATEINAGKTEERTPVESVTLPQNNKNAPEKHTTQEDSLVSGNREESNQIPSKTEASNDGLNDAESSLKNANKSVFVAEVTTKTINDPINDIIQSVSQVFDGTIAKPQRPVTITEKLETEESPINEEAAKPSDISTTTVKAAEVKVDIVQTTPVKTTGNPSLTISPPTTTTTTAESTSTQTTSQAEISTSTATPQVIEKAMTPTEAFTTTGQVINKPSFQEVTTQKVNVFTSSHFKESAKDTTAGKTTIKFSKPVHKSFSSTGTGKSFTSNFIEDHNQVATNHISHHFGFNNPSLMNTISHKTFMFHGVPTDPKTLVPPQYRDFIYYNDAPEVTAAKIAFFRFQASLSPIHL